MKILIDDVENQCDPVVPVLDCDSKVAILFLVLPLISVCNDIPPIIYLSHLFRLLKELSPPYMSWRSSTLSLVPTNN